MEPLDGKTARKVLEIIFSSPEKRFSLSDLSRLARVSKRHLSETLRSAEKRSVVSIEKLPKIWQVKADIDSQDYRRAKLLSNLEKLYSSGLVDFLSKFYGLPHAIVLFGSYRTGHDISTSDIDLLIVGPAQGKEYAIFENVPELVPFEKKLARKIEIHSAPNTGSLPSGLLNNILNGIVLSGILEISLAKPRAKPKAEPRTEQKAVRPRNEIQPGNALRAGTSGKNKADSG